jgi:hypothetical protein
MKMPRSSHPRAIRTTLIGGCTKGARQHEMQTVAALREARKQAWLRETATRRPPPTKNGKEGVDGSSPSEGSFPNGQQAEPRLLGRDGHLGRGQPPLSRHHSCSRTATSPSTTPRDRLPACPTTHIVQRPSSDASAPLRGAGSYGSDAVEPRGVSLSPSSPWRACGGLRAARAAPPTRTSDRRTERAIRRRPYRRPSRTRSRVRISHRARIRPCFPARC